MCVGHDAEQRLAELDTLCRQKEEERVELELRLTEVKENLKKSLARGALGPPTDTRIIIKVGCRQKQLANDSLDNAQYINLEYIKKYTIQ